jgi:hypothetical protein
MIVRAYGETAGGCSGTDVAKIGREDCAAVLKP